MESSELTNANTSQSQHFKALKELKEADKQFFSIQNRIKAIQINEMKNLKRVENSQREVEKIMQIRQQNQQKHHLLKKDKEKRETSLIDLKKKNQMAKEVIESRIRQNQQEITMHKSKNREEMQKQSRIFHQKISNEKQTHLSSKKHSRNKVSASELRSQENILAYLKKKTSELHQSKQKDRKTFQSKKEKRDLDIENLNKVEIQLLQKFSQSQTAFKEAKAKLSTVLCCNQPEGKDVILPSISGSRGSLHSGWRAHSGQ